MKIAVRYQSRGGNTKAVAEAIAKTLNVQAETIGTPIDEPVDILFIGGGVYMGDIDSILKERLESLRPETVKSVAAFTTSGSMNGTGKIISILKGRDINTCEALSIKFFTRNLAWLGGKGYVTLSDKQIKSIENFVKQVTS